MRFARLITVFVVMSAFGLFSGRSALAIEEPQFEVISAEGQIELREYGPILAAEVQVQGSRDEAVNSGFRILAAFIFGDNQGEAKIAMTAPVTQSSDATIQNGEEINMTAPVTQSGSGSNWRIRFMMPQAYTKETLPVPNDQRIKIIELPPRRIVVIRFSGMWTENNLTTQKQTLADYIKTNKLRPIGDPTFAFYDPPWKPFFWRRNEVMQEIKR